MEARPWGSLRYSLSYCGVVRMWWRVGPGAKQKAEIVRKTIEEVPVCNTH